MQTRHGLLLNNGCLARGLDRLDSEFLSLVLGQGRPPRQRGVIKQCDLAMRSLRYRIFGQPWSYDAAADGRFLMIKQTTEARTSPQVVVVLNWHEELKRSEKGACAARRTVMRHSQEQ